MEQKTYNTNQIYYNKHTKQFSRLELTKHEDDSVTAMISNTHYYSDAGTTIRLAPVSMTYIMNNLVEIDSIEKFAVFNGDGWTCEDNEDYDEALDDWNSLFR